MNEQIKQRITQLNNGEVPSGYEKTEFGIFPKDWVLKTIGEVSLVKGSYGLNAPACVYEEGLPKYLRITDIDENGNYINNDAYVNHKESKKYILHENDIVFARTGASVGKNYLYSSKDGELSYAGFLIKFSIDETKCVPYMVKANCRGTRYDKWVQIMSTRSGQPGINAEEYADFYLIVPNSIEEQSKITEILMKWDEAIELQEEFLHTLEIKRMAILQSFFYKEKCSNWIKLSDYVKVVSNRNNIGCQNVKSVSNKNGFIDQSSQFSKQVASEDVSKYKVVTKDCVAYNPSRINVGSIAIYNEDTPGIVSPMYVVFKCVNMDPRFLLLLLETARGKYEVKSYLSGSVRDSLAFEDLKSIELAVPPKEKWGEIVDILNIIDAQYSLYNDKLSFLKRQRKALQQYLLNGIVRV
jgi:type I restriction enzyme S subunit